jgi:hypothetical protein
MLPPTLIQPHLDVKAAWADKSLPRRFKRAEKRVLQASSVSELAAEALHIEVPPAGGLARLADGLETVGEDWFRAQPVMLVPDRDSLRLVPIVAEQALSEEENAALVESARAHFGNRIELESGASGRWYVKVEGVKAVRCVPPESELDDKLLVTSLADGPDARTLRAFLNELQMLWFEHPVNVARREQHRLEANALWLWGNGVLQAAPDIDKPTWLVGRAPEIEGLARWLDCDFGKTDATPEGGPDDGLMVVLHGENEECARAWLRAFAATRKPWRLVTSAGEWRVPARRGVFAWRG